MRVESLAILLKAAGEHQNLRTARHGQFDPCLRRPAFQADFFPRIAEQGHDLDPGIDPLPVKHGSPTKAVPGWDVRVLDADGKEAEPEEIGNIVCKLPMPPGAFPTLWQAEDRFFKAYLERYPGFYLTADAGYRDTDGYVYIMSRIDDIINVAGHRLSTGAIEEVLASHPDVAECAVIIGYIAGRLQEGLFIWRFGIEIHTWRPIDSWFRLITARRNPNLLILTVAALLQAPDKGLLAVAWWTIASFIFHTIRILQAFAGQLKGRAPVSWLQAQNQPGAETSAT